MIWQHLHCGSKQRRKSNIFNRWSHLLFTVTLTIIFQTALADKCSCAPVVYRWTLDLDKTCPIKLANGFGSDGTYGVESTSCFITALNDDTNDFIPVNVTQYQIIELDLNLVGIKQESGVPDGNEISFTSLAATGSPEIPGGIQATIEAVNSEGKKIELGWIMSYTNLCEVDTFQAGDEFGWMVLNDNFVGPRAATCQAPSEFPSLSPTGSPSRGPTINPTFKPSAFPTKAPSTRPTSGPTWVPTLSPSKAPSPKPTSSPTPLPTTSPSKPRTPLPSSEPSVSHSPDMMASAEPSISASNEPSIVPSNIRQKSKSPKNNSRRPKSSKSKKGKKGLKSLKKQKRRKKSKVPKDKKGKKGAVRAKSLDKIVIVGPTRHRS